jgi:hypothetical protein
MNRTQSLSVILLLGATVACGTSPGVPGKDVTTGEVDSEAPGFEQVVDADGPTEDDDDGGEDATTDTEDDADFGDTGDAGDTGETGETDDGFEREPPSAEAFAALTEAARADRVQVHTVDASYYIYLTGDQGTILDIPFGSFANAESTRVTGRVDIELVELYDKGSMLVTDMPSTGLNGDGDRAQLISGGEHYINATQDGEQLELVSDIRVLAPVDNTGAASTEMTRFRAVTEGGDVAGLDDADVWIEEDAKVDVVRAETDTGVTTIYSMLTSQFGWTNVDRWYSDPREKTTLEVRPPVGWDDTNSAVYLSYDGEPTALAGLDTFDDTAGIFSEHYGLIPVGLEVHVIFVTATDDGWAYAIEGTTITAGQEITFDDPDALLEIDTDGLVDIINDLP